MPGKVKAYELQSKCVIISKGWRECSHLIFTLLSSDLFDRNKADLTKQLAELKHDLLTLRVQKIAGGSAAKLTKMFVPLALWSGMKLGNTDDAADFALLISQQCRSQVHCPGDDCNQPKGPTTPSRVLQEKEVPPS